MWQNLNNDTPPSSLCDPKRVQRVGFAELVRNLVPFPASSTKKGRGVEVRSHYACIWCWDKPRANSDSHDTPQFGLGGSHHLPPYSILCSSPPRLHPSGYFSRDSQVGVPKLSQLESWDFGSSYLPTIKFDWNEV
jgi:hypothetical protein